MTSPDVGATARRTRAARDDKPVTTLATRITNQDGVVVLDGSAVVWRDPEVAEQCSSAGAGKSAGRSGS